jgi:hypothetical protein
MSQGDREYLHSLTSGLLLPAGQALLTGLLVALVVTVLGLALRWRGPVKLGSVIGLLACGLAWLSTWRHWRLLTLGSSGKPEVLLPQAFEGAVTATTQPKQRQEIRVIVSEVTSSGHLASGQYLDLPCSEAQLLELLRGLLEQGLTFSERSFCGSGKPFSLGSFRELRNVLQDRGIIAPASLGSPQQGYSLTLAGKHIFTGVLEEMTGG